MENLTISAITNTLPERTVVLRDDDDREIVLHPGERMTGISRLTIPFLQEGATLQNGDIRLFRTEKDGEVVQYAYTCKESSGIISALGPNMQDFLPPSNIHTSIPEVTPGQTVSLTFNIDAENITWIIGDIDSL